MHQQRRMFPQLVIKATHIMKSGNIMQVEMMEMLATVQHHTTGQ